MKVLVVHNYYQQPGGEDLVFSAEVDLLRRHGHDVETLVVHNDALSGMGRLEAARKTIWNREKYAQVLGAVRRARPTIVHFHNTFPLVSPAAYHAARRAGAAVVQTLHNYRLLCPAATFFRNGRVCEQCLQHRIPWPAVAHRCYRASAGATVVSAAMLTLHRALGTWDAAVDGYIALTNHSRRKFIEGGLPGSKIFVKPNFVDPDPGAGRGDGGYLLYAGRLSPEKGVRTLLEAWSRHLAGRPRLKIVGDGPLRSEVVALDGTGLVEYLGRQPLDAVHALVGEAEAMIVPSVCFETFGRTIVEAYAKGTPVIASDLGAMAELVRPGTTGLLFQPGDACGLARAVLELTQDGGTLARMRTAARHEYLARYSGERNHAMLLDIYRHAAAAREGCTHRERRKAAEAYRATGDDPHSAAHGAPSGA